MCAATCAPQWCADWLEFVLMSFNEDRNLIARVENFCFLLEIVFSVTGQRPALGDLENVWKVLSLALEFQKPEAAVLDEELLLFLWPYFTATLEIQTRNSFVALRELPGRHTLCEGLRRGKMLLQDLDSLELMHVWPHLAESMLVRYNTCFASLSERSGSPAA